MKRHDLQRAIEAAVTTGRLGTPVSLTLHCQQGRDGLEPAVQLACLMPLPRSLFGDDPATMTAQQSVDGGQVNLLFTYAGGQSAIVTLGRGAVTRGRLQLLVVGNEGIARLEGDEPLEGPAGDDDPVESARWASRLAESLAAAATITL